jgi:ferredoxin
VCEPNCPADAILPDTEKGIDQWVQLNRKYSGEWPNITSKGNHPADADAHKGEEGKFDRYFSAKPGASAEK